MLDTKEIKVKVFEGQTKEGKKFNYFKAVQKNGQLIDLRFRKEIKDLPENNNIIVIKNTDINLDTNRLYPCLWVKAIQEIKEIPTDELVDKKALELF